MRVIE